MQGFQTLLQDLEFLLEFNPLRFETSSKWFDKFGQTLWVFDLEIIGGGSGFLDNVTHP